MAAGPHFNLNFKTKIFMNARNFTFSPADWFWLIFLSVLWGASFFFTKAALSEWHVLWVVGARLFFAMLTMLLVISIMKIKIPLDIRSLKVYAVLGLINNFLPFLLFTSAQLFINSGLTAVVNALTPLFVILLATLFRLEDQMTFNKFFAVLLGFTGVVIMMLPALDGTKTSIMLALGVLIATIGALFYGFSSLYARHHKGINPMAMATGMICFSALYANSFAFALVPFPLFIPKITTLASLLAIGTLSTAAAYMIFYHLLARVGAANTASVTFLIPITAILLGSLVYHERFEISTMLGVIFIFTALAFLDTRWMKILKPKTK